MLLEYYYIYKPKTLTCSLNSIWVRYGYDCYRCEYMCLSIVLILCQYIYISDCTLWCNFYPRIVNGKESKNTHEIFTEQLYI